jgi:uncharacterized protein (UPF0335 family)
MARRKKVHEPEIKLGHNGGPLMEDQKAKLSGYMEEIERQERMKQVIVDDLKAIYESARDTGFDTKAMRHVVKVRKADRRKQEALENAVDVYKHALGMLSDLPLGAAAIKRDLNVQVDLEEAIAAKN